MVGVLPSSDETSRIASATFRRASVSVLQAVMDRRIAFRLAIVVAGMLLADDRRTASSWFVAAGVQDDWDRFYDCLTGIGRMTEKLALAVLGLVIAKVGPRFGDWSAGDSE